MKKGNELSGQPLNVKIYIISRTFQSRGLMRLIEYVSNEKIRTVNLYKTLHNTKNLLKTTMSENQL